MPGKLRFKITEARPLQTLAKVHFGDDNAAPLVRFDDQLALLVQTAVRIQFRSGGP